MRVHRVPGPSSTWARVLLGAVLAAPALAAAPTLPAAPASAAAPAATATMSSWAERPGQFFVDVDYATPTTLARGRLWQVSFMRSNHPVLRSRRLSDGRASRAVEVAVPRPPGGELFSASLGGDDSRLFVAGHQAFMTGSWCAEWEDGEEGRDCTSSESFYVRFSTRTGRVFDRAVTQEPRRLVGGARVTYVSQAASGPLTGAVVLRDAITRRTVDRLPSDAQEIEGAGRYVAWKTPTPEGENESDRTADAGPMWTTLHVRRRGSGRGYDLRQVALLRAVQPGTQWAATQDSALAPDGSLRLRMDLDHSKSFRPVVVDARGRIRRASAGAMRDMTTFWSEVRGSRQLLMVAPDGRNACSARSPHGWMTDLGAHRGVDLDALPHPRGYRVGSAPSFLTATTMSWLEHKVGRRTASRERIGRDFRRLPLTARERPRC